MNTYEQKSFSDFKQVDIKKILAGVAYLLLIGVVIYGMQDHVYDGFGKLVPWLIMFIFAFMGVIRLLEGIKRQEFRTIVSAALRRYTEQKTEDSK